MLLIDLTHTSHTLARTGIQRVCRSLRTSLLAAGPITSICHDPYLHAWRPLQSWEEANLGTDQAVPSRGARWPLHARLAGRGSRLLKRRSPVLPSATGLVVPEVFSAAVAGALPALFSSVNGPRVVLFHDAIALKFPELSPVKTVARFPGYLRELTQFDGVAAVSEDSRQCLLDYWKWAGITDVPPVQTITLGLDLPPGVNPAPPAMAPGARAIVLSVGSIEGRKNHVALLDACERLWSSGHDFSLHLIGLTHPQTGRRALQKIRALQAAGRSLVYDGPVDDALLHTAYHACAFTVYPSMMEGFGLPVLESLSHGKTCICSSRGALGESARGGGCLTLDSVDAPALAEAMAQLLTDPATLARRNEEARRRTFKSWTDYAAEFITWMGTLKRRP